MEGVNYDPETGQLLSGSFMDYVMPRADDFCHYGLSANEVPTERNPLGVKGVGEAGTVGAMPAVMNAVNARSTVSARPGSRCRRARKRSGGQFNKRADSTERPSPHLF